MAEEFDSVEQEVVEATGVKDEYKDRQDYLAAIVKALDRLPTEEFDVLSDGATDWFNDAVKCMNRKQKVPEFPDLESDDEDSQELEGGLQEQESGQDQREGEGAGHSEILAQAPEVVEIGEVDDELEQQIKQEGNAERDALVEKRRKATKAKRDKVKNTGPKIDYSKLTGEKDKFGCFIGTKTAMAVEMYAHDDGATLKEVEEKIGGRHYNILTKLAKAGHRVERLEGKRWRVVHKDDIPKTSRKKA